jgi:hypothetical protein
MRDDRPGDAPEDRAISELYASTRDAAHTPQPDAEREARILAAAREAVRPVSHRRAWLPAWAAAAVVMLALGVVWQAWRTGAPTVGDESVTGANSARQRAIPIGEAPASADGEMRAKPAWPAEAEMPAMASPAAPRSLASPGPPPEPVVPELQALQPAGGATLAMPAPRVDLPATAADAGADRKQTAAEAAAVVPETDPRLAPVYALLDEGRTAEARAALAALLAEAPGLVLDERLRALADGADAQ